MIEQYELERVITRFYDTTHVIGYLTVNNSSHLPIGCYACSLLLIGQFETQFIV